MQQIISKGNKHGLGTSTVYFFDLTDSNTFIAGANKKHIFKIYSNIKSVNF